MITISLHRSSLALDQATLVNQLTHLYDAFCHALDSGKEIRVVFCNISRALDRVWHSGLIQQLKTAGVTGNLLQWFRSYLEMENNVLCYLGSNLSGNYIKAGVPQGSILDRLLFLLYINDIVTEIRSNIRLFADDTSLCILL